MHIQSFPGGHAVVFDATQETDRRAILASMGRLAGKTPLDDARDEVKRYEWQLADHRRMSAVRPASAAFGHVEPMLELKLAGARKWLAEMENGR